MAISPNVNAYMQQDMGGQTMQSADQMFVKQFSDQAYNVLRAKFPALLSFVVTMKVLASDIDAATAFGVFSIRKGPDLVYIPVVMAAGNMTSCEMVYDKTEDQFAALTESVVKEIINANSYSDPSILNKNPRVENTRALFTNMVRPPMSSNVVLAAYRPDIAELPDTCKQIMSDYLLKTNPHLLAKMASFYDLDILAEKLAQGGQVKQAESEELTFLDLNKARPEQIQGLSKDERHTLLKCGYVIKQAEEQNTVIPEQDLMPGVEKSLRLCTYPGVDFVDSDSHFSDNPPFYHYQIEKAYAIQASSSGLLYVPVLCCGRHILGQNSTLSLNQSETILVTDQSHQVTVSDLQKFKPVVPASEIMSVMQDRKDHWLNVILFVPSKQGSFLAVFANNGFMSIGRNWQETILPDKQSRFSKPDRIISCSEYSWGKTIRVSSIIHYGYIINNKEIIIPQESYAYIFDNNNSGKLPVIHSFDDLRKIINLIGVKIHNTDDGAGVNLTDSQTNKTASFASKVAAARYLHEKYALSMPQTEQILNNKKCYIFRKHAEAMPGMFGQPGPGPQGGMEQSNMLPQGSFEQPAFMPDNLNDFAEAGAELQDPDLMDTGILSSFAQNPDIKALLVDYLPEFMTTQDRLGRVILMFSYQKKEMEDFYGTEKYSNLMSSCRKIFQVIGDLVADLKIYINMV